MFYSKKLKIIISIFSVGVILSAISFGIYWYNSKIYNTKRIKEDDKFKKRTTEKNKNSFPKIKANTFNMYVKNDATGLKFIDNEIVLQIIKNITSRFKETEGNIDFDYEIVKGNTKEDDYIILNLKYLNSDSEPEYKSYKIFLE
ncbi:MHO_1590 family protein [Mycoplasma buteonis]|uniref:MHO_1590 family protein n=1 Tax=Mycoplasma buteonis TaxID=171280 RepID=UPI00056C6457|nr:hypothetical protein [Mycoplasma buteonis]